METIEYQLCQPLFGNQEAPVKKNSEKTIKSQGMKNRRDKENNQR